MLSDRNTQIGRIVPYVRHLANQMGLTHWKIEIEETPSSPNTYAETLCADGRRSVRMWLSESFFELDENTQRYTIVHELLHPLYHPIRMTLDSVSSPLGSLLFATLKHNHDDRIEESVDAVADILAPFLPTWTQWLNSCAGR